MTISAADEATSHHAQSIASLLRVRARATSSTACAARSLAPGVPSRSAHFSQVAPHRGGARAVREDVEALPRRRFRGVKSSWINSGTTRLAGDQVRHGEGV